MLSFQHSPHTFLATKVINSAVGQQCSQYMAPFFLLLICEARAVYVVSSCLSGRRGSSTVHPPACLFHFLFCSASSTDSQSVSHLQLAPTPNL